MAVTSVSSGPDPFGLAADIIDPPPWQPEDRPPLLDHQRPPDQPWDLWLLEGGRGSGKTEACARYYAKWMRANPGARGRIIAPTFGDAVEACITGPSGLQTIDPDIIWRASEPGGAKVHWPNGAEALVFGTPTPRDVERFRAGGNRHIDWWEELAANPMIRTSSTEHNAWDQAQLGLRLGTHPHSIGSTTPRNSKKYREIRTLDGTVRTHATLYDNPHTSAEWRAKMEAAYAGTRLGRQEIGGELLDDIEGALWTAALIDLGRVKAAPDLARIVVAVDPAVTTGPESDATGIVAAGKGVDGHGYVLADRTCRLSPAGWARRTLALYDELEADRIVAEVNNGGDLVEVNLRAECDRQGRVPPPFEAVRASRGKQIRAAPVANLYGDPEDLEASAPRVHHVGMLAELEDQLTTWTPEDGESPDRLDAAVWALTELMLEPAPGEPVVWENRVQISPY